MMNIKFTYNISSIADNDKFFEICNKIEKSLPSIIKKKPLVDVDGSVVQEYIWNKNHIKVQNDYYVDVLYVDSEISLDVVFRNE